MSSMKLLSTARPYLIAGVALAAIGRVTLAANEPPTASTAQAAGVSTITSIDFQGTKQPNTIEITASAPLQFEQRENVADKQIILDIHGAKLAKTASRRLDTSSFDSPISQISPYPVKDQPDTVRVVIQMREFSPIEAKVDGNQIHLAVIGAASSANTVAKAIDQPPAAPGASTPPAPPVNDAPIITTQAAPSDRIGQFLASQDTKHFIGKPVTLQVRDVDLADIFRLIAEASGFNIVMGEDVKGRITLSLVDVPWDQALDVVLRTQHLGAERQGNILRVATLTALTNEKWQEMGAQAAQQAIEPRITRVFSISYANILDLAATISKFVSPAAKDGGGGPPAIVQTDNRTNSIIVRDTAENLDRVRKLVDVLDTQTPQVMIEAKIIEASEAFSKSVGGSLGISGSDASNGSITFGSFNGADPVDPMFGSPATFTNGMALLPTGSNPTTGGGTLGLNPVFGILPGLKLSALLNMNESESNAKLVSSPKTVVLNKQHASIVEGTPVALPAQILTPQGGGPSSTGSQVVSANLSLSVTPTVTSDGSVIMDLNISRDDPQSVTGGQGIATRNLQTTVLVDGGSTLVIGGIYTSQDQSGHSGFPFLSRIPIIGWLFGSDTGANNHNELFIFITPRILNVKESALNG